MKRPKGPVARSAYHVVTMDLHGAYFVTNLNRAECASTRKILDGV